MVDIVRYKLTNNRIFDFDYHISHFDSHLFLFAFVCFCLCVCFFYKYLGSKIRGLLTIKLRYLVRLSCSVQSKAEHYNLVCVHDCHVNA